jgi:hypothetical protein
VLLGEEDRTVGRRWHGGAMRCHQSCERYANWGARRREGRRGGGQVEAGMR